MDDSHLEALLRKEEAYLADDGFTEGVMRALPAPATKGALRAAILIFTALAGGLLGALSLGKLALPAFPPATGQGLAYWLGLAFTWSPASLPISLPLLPMLLGLAILVSALAWTRANAAQ